MKILRLLFIVIIKALLLGCSSSKVAENRLYKTKIYAGYYIKSTYYDSKYTTVLTSEGLFRLRDNPDIPDSTWCYIRVEPTAYDVHPDIRRKLEPVFFTWNGTDREYKVFNEIKIH